jgi:hypothetical protein
MARTSKRIAREDEKEVMDRRTRREDDKILTDDGALQRTVTILEMTRWGSDPLVAVQKGDEDKDSLLPEEENVDETEKPVEHDVHTYMARREMTEQQELWNALTMIPSPLYCIYYLLAGKWLTYSQEDYEYVPEFECAHSPIYYAPLPVIFVALAIILHAPFSFLYHYKYACALPAGLARTDHWSRRLDQAMIHAASALISYSTSGSWYYFIANFFYNADCIRRHFEKKVRHGIVYMIFHCIHVSQYLFLVLGSSPSQSDSHCHLHGLLHSPNCLERHLTLF